MTDLVLQNESMLIAPSSSSNVLVFHSGLHIDGDVSTVVLKDNPAGVLTVGATKTFAVVNHNIISYPGTGSGTGIKDAPYDNNPYVRENGHWVEFNYETFPPPQDSYLYTQVENLLDFQNTALGNGIDPNDAFTTINQLIDLGVLEQSSEHPGGIGPTGPVRASIPPAPVGLMAQGRWDAIEISWQDPRLQYINHSHVKLYRSVTNNFATAVVIETLYTPNQYSDFGTEADVGYFYWIRSYTDIGTEGPVNSPAGTYAELSDDPGNILQLLTDEITATQLHESLLTPIESIGPLTSAVEANNVAIINEANTRHEQITAEATAREVGLLNEAAERGTAIDSAVTILETADLNLASQVDFVTSTTNATFDAINLWQFDSGIEDWTSSGGVPVSVSGYLRPAFSTDTYLQSPEFAVDGSVFNEVRLRIRKVGSPTWTGVIRYTVSGITAYDSSHQVIIPEPVFFGQQATVIFYMNQSPDWEMSVISSIRIQMSLVSDASNYYELDWVGIGRAGPGASLAAIVEEREAWTTALAAEAVLRTTLAAQLRGTYTGTDLDEVTSGLVYEEKIARVTANEALAANIASLSVGNSNQFDHVNIWYFDTTIESWTGNGAPTIVISGWLRPADHVSDPYVRSPAITVDGTKYTQVRARIRKVGTPVWDGKLKFITTVDTAWDTVKQVTVPEPVYTDGIATLTYDITLAEWVGKTVTNIQLEMSVSQSVSDYFEVDWIAVGRPSPGASSAELVSEQQARLAADGVHTSAINTLNAQMLGKASVSAVDALALDVTDLEGVVTAQGTKLVSLESQLNPALIAINPNFADWSSTYPTGWGAWSTTAGISKYTGPYAYTGGNAVRFNIGAYNVGLFQLTGTTIPDAPFIDVEVIFTLVSGSLSGAGIHINWMNTADTPYGVDLALSSVYPDAAVIYGKKCVAKFRCVKPSGFTGVFREFIVYVMGNYTGIGTLAAKDIIFDRVVFYRADASASAISSLTTTVTNQGGQIAAQATDITSLKATAPGGGNLLNTDSEFKTSGNSGWVIDYAEVSGGVLEKGIGSPYGVSLPLGVNCLILRTPGLTTVGSVSTSDDTSMPVIAGKRYSATAYVSAYRATSQILIFWYNTAGGWFNTSYAGAAAVNNMVSSADLAAWPRIGDFVVAPAGAVSAKFLMFHSVVSGMADPFTFFCRPMFCEVAATTTVHPPYSVSGGATSTAAIQITAEAAASTANSAVARWEVKTTVGDLTGGVGFYNDGVKTRFMIHADVFSVYSPGSSSFGMIIDGGKVVMDGAYIKNLSVSTLQLGNSIITDAKIQSLYVDTINGNTSDVYYSGPHTSAFTFGGAGSSYGGTGGSQTAISWITIPARSNARPYGTQFFTQGVATKSVAGVATIVSDYFTTNPSPSVISTLGSPSDCSSSGNSIQRVITYPNGTTPSNPSNWDTVSIGEVVTARIDDSNIFEGVVINIITINTPAGPSNFTWGKVFVLGSIVRLGSVPGNLSGATLTRRSTSGRVYLKLGVSMATTVSTTAANEQIMFNMSYYDVSGKATIGRNILTTIGCYSSNGAVCTNSNLDFAVLAGR